MAHPYARSLVRLDVLRAHMLRELAAIDAVVRSALEGDDDPMLDLRVRAGALSARLAFLAVTEDIVRRGVEAGFMTEDQAAHELAAVL
jgi:hypothetical protein